MSNTEKLHRKIRHYLLDNWTYWTSKYQEAHKGREGSFEYKYEPTDYDIFPRYQSNDAILKGVELIVPERFNNIKTLKNEILRLGLSSATIFTKNNKGTAKNAIEDEKLKFKKFVESLTEKDIEDVPDLFYRRRLTENESKETKQFLSDITDIKVGDFWWPIDKIERNKNDYLVINEDDIEEKDEKTVNDIIKSISTELYYLISPEYDDVDYELENTSIDIFNLAGENYIFDSSKTWIVYYSHEDFFIFYGSKLTENIMNAFPKLRESIDNQTNNTP